MSFKTSLFAAIGLLGSVLPVAAQEAPPLASGSDLRSLWADPAIRDFVGMTENGWDFNKPDTIPGFGSLPAKDQPSAAQD